MKRTSFSILLSITGLLLASFSFSGKAQVGSLASSAGSELPEALAGIPGATAEWWTAVQAQLGQELGAQPDLSLTPDWSAVGEAANNFFGYSVASAGDVNGDGYLDLAVGASGYNGATGKAYVYHGSGFGLSASPDWSAVGEAASNYFGFSVASVGDVNGDGYADLAVGALGYNSSAGKAYVYHGSAGGLSASPDWSAAGEATDNEFSFSVASAGDVNGDGYADLAVGAYRYNNNQGKAYVYHGSAGGLSASPGWTAVGEATTSSSFGHSVASTGDVNGDSYADLAVGASGYNSFTGKVYVYHGSVGGLSASPDWSTVGEATLNGFGWSVASAGDVNADGYADLAVGAIRYNSLTGKAYVFHGSVGGLSASPDWSAVGEAADNFFSVSVAAVGDVNGDGFADLAVGASGYNSETGKAYVYHGSVTGLSASPDWSAVGESVGDAYGHSVASAGDVNGDGYSDLAVGAHGYNSGTGKAYIYYGSAGCTNSCLRVAEIQMRVDPSKVYASVKIIDENGTATPGAAVSAHWDLPGGRTKDQTKNTDASGSVTFRVNGGAGTYTITITNVVLAGYTFDPANSAILSNSITK